MPFVINGTTGATQSASFDSASTFGFKNRIINGAMVIDQRNAGASVTVNTNANTFCTDRWFGYGQSTDGVFTLQQSSTVPAGFTNSLALTVTTADASIGSTQIYVVAQNIEGLNVGDLGWGTANAQSVTLSFQVRSSLTGTFGGSLRNSAGDRSYPFTYTISSANTWETKTITIAGDTSGTWLTTNGIGIRVTFGVGVGSTYLGTANAWAGSNYLSATGATNIIATSGATFYITGVQLEKGSTATSFDYRPYGTELALCQRYYQDSLSHANSGGSAAASVSSTGELMCGIAFKVTMRSAPSITLFDQAGTSGKVSRLAPGASWNNGATGSATDIFTYGFTLSSGSGSAGAGVFARFKADAEL
jgi:hypothetical protein